MSTNSTSLSLFEIQNKVFLENMQSFKDLKMADDCVYDDDFLLDEEDIQKNNHSMKNCVSDSDSQKQSNNDIQMDDISNIHDLDECEEQRRYSITSEIRSPSIKSTASTSRRISYERLNNCKTNKLDQVMDKIKFEEKIQEKIQREYNKNVSQQCSKNIYELFDIPESTESNLYGFQSPRMKSSLKFAFN